MSSKSLNKKSDNKNDKAEQEDLKEVEIIAELAPNEKTRKEAEKLIETVENESTTSLQETKSNPQSNSIAQDSSEIFDSYKQGVLKVTEELSKFQPNYAESISKLQEEYIQLTKEFVNKVFAATKKFCRKQRNIY